MTKAIFSACVVVVGILGFATASAAATILLNNCDTVGLCDQVQVTTTLVGDTIDVDVTDVAGAPPFAIFGDSGANRAFAFNVAGSLTGLAFSNFTPGFSFHALGANIAGDFGDYDVVLNGPHTASSAALPLHFTVSRTDGFSSELDLFEANEDGYFFNAHVRNTSSGVGGWAAANGAAPGTTAVPMPEPASMMLLGTGLAGLVARRVRRRS